MAALRCSSRPRNRFSPLVTSREQRQHSSIGAKPPNQAQRQTDRQFMRRHVNDVTDDPCRFERSKPDNRNVVRNNLRQAWVNRVMHDAEAEQERVNRRQQPLRLHRMTSTTNRPRRMPHAPALRALLKAQFALRAIVPKLLTLRNLVGAAVERRQIRFRIHRLRSAPRSPRSTASPSDRR